MLGNIFSFKHPSQETTGPILKIHEFKISCSVKDILLWRDSCVRVSANLFYFVFDHCKTIITNFIMVLESCVCYSVNKKNSFS